MDSGDERENYFLQVHSKYSEIIYFTPQMAWIILTGLEYPHRYVLPPRKTFPGAGGVQEGGQKAGEWGYSMYCGMSGILLSVARLRTPGQHLPSSPTHLCKLLSTLKLKALHHTPVTSQRSIVTSPYIKEEPLHIFTQGLREAVVKGLKDQVLL